jgi:SAM-dependent methyltransferase
MDYESSFKNRIESYLKAITQYPKALSNEFATAINILNLSNNEVLLNIPAGGIPLQDYINPDLHIEYIAYDTHKGFTHDLSVKYCSWSNIPLPVNSVDKIICLASLHHLTTNERIIVYNEFYRILKPDGKLIIGDVIKNSDQALWLDNFVDKYNSSGHKATFFDKTDSNLLEKHNFNVDITIKSYDWIFNENDNVYLFCKLLFGLDLIELTDSNLINGVDTILKYKNNKIPWKLIYFICTPINKYYPNLGNN